MKTKENNNISNSVRKWYVEILPPHGEEANAREQFILQSDWFDTRKDAIEWANKITYKDYKFVEIICLMYSDGKINEDGEWEYLDIEQEKYLSL